MYSPYRIMLLLLLIIIIIKCVMRVPPTTGRAFLIGFLGDVIEGQDRFNEPAWDGAP